MWIFLYDPWPLNSSNKSKNIVEDWDEEFIDPGQHVGKESCNWPKEVFLNSAFLWLSHECHNIVDGAVDIAWNSDLLISHQPQDLNELSWKIEEEKSRHIADNGSQVKGVCDYGSGQSVDSFGCILPMDGGCCGESLQRGDEIKLELTGGSVHSLAQLLPSDSVFDEVIS